ncbi:hypothetical protein Bca52824_020092 [Brassica carinata]|uniref:LOB domain-containing protein n=1 Tax=Brassica carinata TaxID=52824 RepID=A0A8X7VTI2_BRACI|nr:hypothetical protein Bca52824_020092 [Brassica carinata]
MASSNSPCSACKFLRRKCTRDCVFAPYFPPDQPKKFVCVHRAFGASNVAKLLSDLPSNQREDVVTSLVYEAETRFQDPVYGCVGLISLLQQRLKQLQQETDIARRELATYIGPQAMLPIFQPHQTQFMPQLQSQQTDFRLQTQQTQSIPEMQQPQSQTQRPSSSSSASLLTQQDHHSLFPTMTGEVFNRQQQQNLFEAQDLESAARDWQHNGMFRAYGEEGSSSSHDHHQKKQAREEDILRFNSGSDFVTTGSVTSTGYNQLPSSGTTRMSSSLALGGNYDFEAQLFRPTQSSQHQPQQQHHEVHIFMPLQSSQLLPVQTHEKQTNSESDEEGS